MQESRHQFLDISYTVPLRQKDMMCRRINKDRKVQFNCVLNFLYHVILET